MKICFLTRFSFFGKSGWKSKSSTDPDLLFAPERLDPRFEMFEKITLRSLADQTDPDFDHMVLSSSFMPEHYRKQLKDLCGDYLGDRAKVLFRRYKYVSQVVHNFTLETYGDEDVVMQSVLDDDDAVSVDFVEAMRFEAETVQNTPYHSDPVTFLTFPRGFTLGLQDGEAPWLAHRHVPFTNLGLCILKPPSHNKNLFNISHLKVGKRYGSRMAGSHRPFYLRTVHDHNDSRARHSNAMLDQAQVSEQFRYFPLLESLFASEAESGDAQLAQGVA